MRLTYYEKDIINKCNKDHGETKGACISFITEGSSLVAGGWRGGGGRGWGGHKKAFLKVVTFKLKIKNKTVLPILRIKKQVSQTKKMMSSSR